MLRSASQTCRPIYWILSYLLVRNRTLIGASSLAMVVVIAGAAIMALALHRYDGADGLVRRVRAEFAVEQPHPEYVPLPEELDIEAARGSDPETPASSLSVPISEASIDGGAASQGDIRPAPVVTSPTSLARARGHGQLAALAEPDDEVRPVAAARDQPTPTPKPSATATPPPVFPATKQLAGLSHYWQTWNNCGPATLSMNLSYFGIKVGQDRIGAVLRPEKDDKNVSPQEMADFARSQGLQALVRVNGDATRVKALLAADIPVLVETWYEPEPNDGMGHYRLIVGYDDAAKTWIAYDSYDSHGIKKGEAYAGIRLPYDSFDKLWKVFGRTYLAIYDGSRAAAVMDVLGADLEEAAMWKRALAADLAEAQANPQDAFAWFNVGTDYVALGDFKAAAEAYDTARRMKLPWRMLWYQFGPFRAYYEVGRHQEVVSLADATIKTAVHDEELFFWKGLSQKALGDPVGAKASLQQAVKLRPSYQDAQSELAGIE